MTPGETSVSSALCDLVGRLGPGAADHPDDLEAQLLDICAEGSPRELAAVVAAAREGIPRKLQGSRTAPFSVVSAVLARRWANQSGTDETLAMWAITAWAKALGIVPAAASPVERTISPEGATLPHAKTQPAQPKTAESKVSVRQTERARRFAYRAAWIAAAVLVVSIVAWSAYSRSRHLAAARAVHDGDLARAAQKLDESLAYYKKAERLDPSNVGAWVGEGRVAILQKQYVQALVPLERAIALDARSGPAFLYDGIALEYLDRYADAEPALATAARFAPRDVYTLRNLAYVRYKRDEYPSALATARRALALSSDHWSWRIACESAYAIGYATVDADGYRYCKVAVQYFTDNSYLWEARGWSILTGNHSNEYAAASDAFKRSIELNKNDQNAIVGLSSVDIRLGDYADSLRIADTGLTFFPQNSGLWNDRGAALDHLGSYVDAYRSFRKAVALNPHDVTARSNMRKLLAAYPSVALMP